MLPVQIVVPPVTSPAYVAESTVTVVAIELTEFQTPFLTTALN